MDEIETQELMDDVASVMRSVVGSAVAPLMTRIEQLEKRLSEATPRDVPEDRVKALVASAVAEMPKPRDGLDADPVAIQQAVDAAVERAIAAIPAPRDGKDADPEQIKALVAEAVSRIPAPKDGRDGKDIDPEAFAARLEEAVAKGIEARMEAERENLQRAYAEAIDAGRAEGLALVKAEVKALWDANPPRDGADGQPGKDAEPVTAEQIVEAVSGAPEALDEAVKRHLEANPVPAGRDGAAGKDGADGKSVTVEDVAPVIAEQVAKAVAALPVPKDGRDGADGKDGVGLGGALIDREGKLIVTLTDGTTRDLGPVCGRDGAPGKDGRDGFGFDDLSAEYDGERTVTLAFRRGEEAKTFSWQIPVVLDRGVYKQGEAYAPGDGVTWAGSFWIAQEATSDKPETTKAWRLAVKRGRDGKEGAPGRDLRPEQPVKANKA